MAPILSLLRTMAERGLQRKATFFYGARTRGTCASRPSYASWSSRLPGFRYLPALSEPPMRRWDGETGLITDVVKRHASDLTGAHAYVCGPPPMVEAALPLLAQLGVEEKRVYYDKFTTTGEPGSNPTSDGNARAMTQGNPEPELRSEPDRAPLPVAK